MAKTPRPCPIPADELRRRYTVRRQSVARIARELGVSEYAVNKWLRDAGIRVRSRAEANRLSGFHRHTNWPDP
ncbi:hypothetical protein [Streptomyces sp. URMC 129]|uniref:hypothetical protein n=1 Tax=Streptomyces sp. URMC 129 TaxID=3423407 RepID=UPI003F1A6B5B